MSRTSKNKTKGQKGEDLAQELLVQKGFKILEKNWRYSRYGEIDIIALHDQTLVFIEVKARTNLKFGHPEESITPKKMEKIRFLAEVYLNKNENLNFENIRFDVISILLSSSPEIIHIQDVLSF